MKWLTILFALCIVVIIILANMGILAALRLTEAFPHIDKVGHFLLFGILALLVNWTLFRARPHHSRKRIALITGLILALLIGAEEGSQRLFANRTFSLADLTASYLGVVFFSWLAVRTQR